MQTPARSNLVAISRSGWSTRLVAGAILSAVVLVATPRPARAGDGPFDTPTHSPGLSYLWDGGALPFFWLALGGNLAINRWVAPRSTPLLFSATEGGLPRAPWEVPDWSILVGGAATAVTIALAGDASGWDHAKGLAESLATGGLITQTLKVAFGRHRPDWTAADTDPGQRKSFPSGHATEAFAIATYAVLYLHEHVFHRMDEPQAVVSAAKAFSYTALIAGASALAYERGYHNRHHVSDIVVGSALGTAESTLFFLYQEGRYRHRDSGSHALTVLPAATNDSAGLRLGGVF